MSFRFYIMDSNEGIIQGTDDQDTAHEFAESYDYFVVDTRNNLWLQPGSKSDEVEGISLEEIEPLNPEENEDD